MSSSRTAIGIDLGTTYSCVAVFQNGSVEIIANDQGNRITPSYVSFQDDERLIGDASKNASTKNPTQTVYEIKRMIGRDFEDPILQKDLKLLIMLLMKKVVLRSKLIIWGLISFFHLKKSLL